MWCKCGKQIRKSSLSRHIKKYGCSKDLEMPKENHGLQTKPNTCEQHKQNGNTRTFKLQTDVHVTTKEDGTVIFTHDPIEIDGRQMVVAPVALFQNIEIAEYAFPDGKY